ncbi:MAG: hypothetical protein IJ733_09260 [Lachnospiraceae bacterium]|nr:hypothetical protein [Lachnospiraceae bacterium]
MRCNHCGFEILDGSPVCPFCKMALRQGNTEVSNAYPEIREQFRRRKRILAAVLFFVIMVESILVLINVFTLEANPYPWSVLLGGILVFLFLCLWNIFRVRVGHIAKIYMQMGLFLLLLLFLDKMLGKHGVFIGYGLPILIDSFLVVILFCMLVNHKNYQNYILLQFFMVMFSAVTLLLMVTGVLKNQKLISTSLVASVLFFLGTVMLGHRKVRQELKRKFHI